MTQQNIPFGIPRCRLKDNIKMEFKDKLDCVRTVILLAQDEVQR